MQAFDSEKNPLNMSEMDLEMRSLQVPGAKHKQEQCLSLFVVP